MFNNKLLRKLREENDLSFGRLRMDLYKNGECIVSENTLKKWEKDSEPRASQLYALSKFYGKPMNYFFKKVKR